jgi:hypothetical protein
MIKKIALQMLPLLFSMLTPELLRRGVDALLDVIEEAVEKSPNKIDDIVVLPLCKLIRNTFDIPDED